ncbi:hypothetical protein [Anoxynatronum sibiricum]|uniref:Flagellar FliJ protein n=1 Tax=Anoxynatronum sibiricum TaxID=210623 RepID=A0ABU9VZC5_9CLOT
MTKLEMFIEQRQTVATKVQQFQQRQQEISDQLEQLDEQIQKAMMDGKSIDGLQTEAMKLTNEQQNMAKASALLTGGRLQELAHQALVEQKEYFEQSQEKLHDLRQQDLENYQTYLDQQAKIIKQWNTVKADCNRRYQAASDHLQGHVNMNTLKDYAGQKLEKYDAGKGIG